jgi:cytochrome c
MISTNSVPIPHDLPLPLPAPRLLLEVLLVVFFILHILFVNLMVGGSLLSLLFEFLGLRRPAYDGLSRAIGQTITVNKSLAVVLGVGPLLVMNLLHTVHFYSANALTGTAWLMVIPLVTLAFLLTYAHKYTWDRLARRKVLHLVLGALPALLFLAIPFIFLVNANLMLFPERWGDVRGFFSALLLPNVLPRYVHFLLASLAVTSLFLSGWFGRSSFPLERILPGFSGPQLRRLFYRITLYVSLIQFLAGPLVYFTLPQPEVTVTMTLVILAGVACASGAILLLRWAVAAPDAVTDRYFWPIVGCLSATVLLMATGRHLYREERLRPHRLQVERATLDFEEASREARQNPPTPNSSTTVQ